MATSLIQLLSPGTVLAAAGARLGRHLAQQYARECRSRGMEFWETPAILTFGAWLGSLWQEAIELGADDRLLLAPAQEAVLWERVIAEGERPAQLLSAAATAGLAAEAWKLVHAWRVPHAELKRAGHDDTQAFEAWATAFERLCRSQRWLDGATLPDALIESIKARRIPVPARLVLAGFDELTPQQTQLTQALRAAGTEVIVLESTADAGRALRVALPSNDDEILAAAQWARARLDADPGARLGILAPDLASQSRVIRRVFDDVLSPAAVLPGLEETPRPYNLSYGEALTALAPVASALAILEFAKGSLPLSQVGELLRSPYLIGSEIELAARAAVDSELRDVGDVEIGIDALAAAIARTRGCPILGERLARLRPLRGALSRAQSPSHWLGVFAQLLASLGWPGDRSRSSGEHQAIEAWRELLRGFGALDPVLPALKYGEALARLRRLAQETLFQRETPETPVQILGVFEASGFEFDALWVMGLQDEVWPAASRPNPFIPVALQRTHRLPHASAERELEFCTRLTQRLLRSAAQIVMSYPAREQDRNLRPSPLISGLEQTSPEAVVGAPTAPYRELMHAAAKQESLLDTIAPAMPEGAIAAGGTALFRAQSACPFRGFAEFRLHACEFAEPEPGLSPADRGILLHDVLSRLWRELGSHAVLCGMAAEKLEAVVTSAVHEAVARLQRERPATVTGRLAALECGRLAALVREWLELEKQRAPFVVRREESKINLSVGGLVTAARMDRVDQLANGDFVVIDYKTGDPKTGDWFGARPAEPQLPLYALYGTPRERVGALLYARLRRGEARFIGIARDADVAPQMEAHDQTRLAAQQGPWPTLLEKWDAALSSLALEHRSGQAQVSPREPKVCENCHLHGFCRIHDRRARLVDGGEGSDD